MYLCDKKAPKCIRHYLPDVRLVACLRYPTDRAYSHCWMSRGKEHTTRSFQEVVQCRLPRFIERGRHGEQLERYLSYFNRSKILVLVHEEMFDEPVQHLNKVCSFLGIDDSFYRNQSWITEPVNRSSAIRSTLLHRGISTAAKWMRDREGLRQMLGQYYAPAIQRVEEVLDRHIWPWQNRSTVFIPKPSA